MHTHAHTCTHMHTRIHIHTHTHTHTHSYTHTHNHTHNHTQTYTHYIYIHKRTDAHLHIHMCTYTCIHTHSLYVELTHPFTHTFAHIQIYLYIYIYTYTHTLSLSHQRISLTHSHIHIYVGQYGWRDWCDYNMNGIPTDVTYPCTSYYCERSDVFPHHFNTVCCSMVRDLCNTNVIDEYCLTEAHTTLLNRECNLNRSDTFSESCLTPLRNCVLSQECSDTCLHTHNRTENLGQCLSQSGVSMCYTDRYVCLQVHVTLMLFVSFYVLHWYMRVSQSGTEPSSDFGDTMSCYYNDTDYRPDCKCVCVFVCVRLCVCVCACACTYVRVRKTPISSIHRII